MCSNARSILLSIHLQSNSVITNSRGPLKNVRYDSEVADNCTKLFVITVNFTKLVRYNHEILLIKHAEPNQATHFVHYNCDRYNRV